MGKKWLSVVMVILIFVASTPIAEAGLIQLFYTDTSSITASLSIDSSGNALCSGKVKPESSSSTTSIIVKLMKKSSGSWSEVKRWTASKSGANGASASGSVKVSKGYSYQVVVNGTITQNGVVLESPTCSSNICSY